MAANMIDIKEDLEWLDMGSGLVLELLYPEGKSSEKTNETEPEAPESAAVRNAPLKNDTKKNVCALETLPELDEDYQTSESGFSAAEELVNQYLNTFQTDVSSPCKRSFEDPVHIASETCSSRFSWNSSSESLHNPKLEQQVWWKPIKPLSIRRKGDETPPPIPERNPLRLLRRLSKAAPQGYGDTSRKSRNFRNLYLDLVQPEIEEITPMKTTKSHRRRSYAREAKPPAERTVVEKPIVRAKTTHDSTSVRKQERDARNAAAWQSVRYGTKVRPRPRSIVKEDGHRRTQSVKETSISSNRHTDKFKNGRGHHRGASDPCDSTARRRGFLAKWDDAMPAHSSSNRSSVAHHKKDSRSKEPKLPFNINKRLPALPSAGKTPGWQFVDDSDG